MSNQNQYGLAIPSINTPSRNITPWLTYTPLVRAGAGLITAYTAAGRYKYIADGAVFVDIQINITTNGTGSDHIEVTLPVSWNLKPNSQWISGIPTTFAGYIVGPGVTTGFALIGTCNQTGVNPYIRVVRYDNVYPGADGFQLNLSGVYDVG